MFGIELEPCENDLTRSLRPLSQLLEGGCSFQGNETAGHQEATTPAPSDVLDSFRMLSLRAGTQGGNIDFTKQKFDEFTTILMELDQIGSFPFSFASFSHDSREFRRRSQPDYESSEDPRMDRSGREYNERIEDANEIEKKMLPKIRNNSDE